MMLGNHFNAGAQFHDLWNSPDWWITSNKAGRATGTLKTTPPANKIGLYLNRSDPFPNSNPLLVYMQQHPAGHPRL